MGSEFGNAKLELGIFKKISYSSYLGWVYSVLCLILNRQTGGWSGIFHWQKSRFR